MDKLFSIFVKYINKKSRAWRSLVTCLSAVVVFTTTYALILPAITLDTDTAYEEPGIQVDEGEIFMVDEAADANTALPAAGEDEGSFIVEDTDDFDNGSFDLTDGTEYEDGAAEHNHFEDDEDAALFEEDEFYDDSDSVLISEDADNTGLYMILREGSDGNYYAMSSEGRAVYVEYDAAENIAYYSGDAEVLWTRDGNSFSNNGVFLDVTAAAVGGRAISDELCEVTVNPVEDGRTSLYTVENTGSEEEPAYFYNCLVLSEDEGSFTVIQIDTPPVNRVILARVGYETDETEADDLFVDDYDEETQEEKVESTVEEVAELPESVAEEMALVPDEFDVTADAESVAEEVAEPSESVSGELIYEGEDYTVDVIYDESAGIPEGADLKVAEILPGTAEYDAYYSQAAGAISENGEERPIGFARFFDISFVIKDIDENGSEILREIEPLSGVDVRISYKTAIPENAEMLPDEDQNGGTAKEDAAPQLSEDAAELNVLHFTEESIDVVPDVEASQISDDEAQVCFGAGSFSVYGLVYTVDFEYSVDGRKYELSIPGGSYISFTELVEALGITDGENQAENAVFDSIEDVLTLNDTDAGSSVRQFVGNVEDVTFSTPALMWVGKVSEETTLGALKEANGLSSGYSSQLSSDEIDAINAQTVPAGDWALVSLQPFVSEETLTVTMKSGDRFEILVTDAQVARSELDDSKGYVIFTKDSAGTYYVLKTDGTTVRFDNADGFDELTNEYRWQIMHIYSEDGSDRYNIHPFSNRSASLALNNPNQPLIVSGPNNIIISENGDGYTFSGYRDTKLVLEDSGSGKTLAGRADAEPAVMYIYEQAALDAYKFDVSSSDTKMGTVSGRDNVGVEKNKTALFTSITSKDKKNAYTIKAEPQSRKYMFDHWELNGTTVMKADGSNTPVGATINAGELEIPYNGSRLEAVFKIDPTYNPPDDEKEGQGYDDASKEALRAWLNELKNRQVPLDPNGCDKTAEVYDYENRIYRVDLTARSSLSTFDGTVDLGFIIDASGSMQFPSKLSPEEGLSDVDINHINDDNNTQHWLDTGKEHYLIADKAGTATVYRLFYRTETVETWYGTTQQTGWWAVDSSYSNSDRRRYYIGSSSRFSNDPAGTHYQIYSDGDNGKKRLDYLKSSINGTVSELNNILGILALAKENGENPDVKIAYNTFCATILHQQHEFASVKDGFNIEWDTNGGTGTDLALEDAKSFNWGTTGTSTKNYAVLITDGAPQAGGKAIASSTVIGKADELKKGPDGIAGTADDVTLITVGLSMGDVKRGSVLLYDLADRDSDNEKMFFKAESGDELEYVLYEIIQKILIDAEVQGKVTDTVGEAFYPVDLATGKPILPGDEIDLQGNVVTGDASYTGPRGKLGDDGKTFTWDNQTFTTEGWHGTVYVKSKEDFLGGNSVRTNEGVAVIEAKSYKTPSMEEPVELKEKTGTDDKYTIRIDDLESPLVNVNELQFRENSTEWTVYLGTEVDPEKELEALYKKIYFEEKVTKAQDLEPLGPPDGLPDHVEGDSDNYLYPLKQSISDKREGEIESGREPVAFSLNDFLKTMVSDKNYPWWDYSKNEPKYKEFFAAAGTGDGIVLDYDAYGINDMEHHLDDNTTKRDGSRIFITLTRQIAEGEIASDADPLDGAHPTKVTGNEVEKYTLTVLHTPDYEILPEGQGGKSIENFHVGSFESMYHGSGSGTETSTNAHTINVYAKPLEVKKTDPEGKTLAGAQFAIYRKAKDGETGTDISSYNASLAGSYVLVSEGTTDARGRVLLGNTENTADTLLVPGETYYLIETHVPSGDYIRDKSVRVVTVVPQNDGFYTDLEKKAITETVTDESGNQKTQFITDITGYTDPYNWSQGVRILVDDKALVEESAPTAQGSDSDAGSGDAGTGERAIRELGASEYIYKADPVQFVTVILNEKNVINLDVTKSWVDDTGAECAKEGHSVTFEVTRKAGETGTPETVDLTGHITASQYVSVSNDGKTITLTYHDGAWPTAEIVNLSHYTNETAETEWIYEVHETICNPSENVDVNKASYEITDVNGRKTIKIINLEKKKTQIEVDKKWFSSDEAELGTAPETSITFEIYRVAHIPCRHTYDDGTVTTEPTCEGTGVKTYTCTKCGDTRTETIPALGHSFSEWSVRTPATYSEDGVEVRVCTVCGKEETRPITKLPHDHVWEELVYLSDADKPTCTEPGTAHRKCTLCGETEESGVAVPALGHDWDDGTTTQAATCEGTGTKHFECTRCHITEDREIAALGHDWVVTDYPTATCTTAGTRHWECRNDASHNHEETIPALGHEFGPWETYIEATETTDGENRRYCIHGCGEYESEVSPKLGETFGDTGLPVSPYEWPYTPPAGVDPNKNTPIKPTGIIKCVAPDGTVSYAIIYKACNPNYNQLAEGPGGSALQNDVVVLTGTIKDKNNIVNNSIRPIAKGDLFRTDDGEYYVFLKNDGAANNMNNGFNPGDWYKIPAAADSGSGTSNASQTQLQNMSGARSAPTRLLAARGTALTAAAGIQADGGTSVNLSAVKLQADGDSQSTDEDTARKARIAKLTGKSVDQIHFRSELEDASGSDVWEFVGAETGSGTNWKWSLDDLDAYDEEGNIYTYYVIETAPDESLYEITYDNNGRKDSDSEKTITINNKQKTGSVKVTKSFSGVERLPDTFKITAAYEISGEPHTVEFTTSPEGVSGTGTDADPYTWTIDRLPIGTVVTFTESGYKIDGYDVTVTGSSTADDKSTAQAEAAASPGIARFINTYTQEAKFRVNIFKIEKDRPSKVLENAEFTLREINEEIAGGQASYKKENDEGTVVTTGADGTAHFDDIKRGYYEVMETGTPAGYVITGSKACYIHVTSDGVKLVVINADGSGWEEVSSDGMYDFSVVSGTAQLTVSNEPGAALPNAGGFGTFWIYLAGLLLICVAGAGLVKMRRV